MRKPYSDETRNDIVEKYLLGESVREIHDSTGVSTGSISEYINDFASKIERKTIDAMHDFFKIIRKNGMQPKDVFYGHVVFSILLKHNLDPKQIHSFVESILSMAKQNELSAERLIGLCNTVSTIQSNSDVPLHEIENHCTELVKTKDELELSIDKLSSQYKQSQNNLSALLKKNKLTEQQVEKTVNALEFLEKFGFDLSDADSVCNMLQNAKSQGCDVGKILSYLSKDELVDLRLLEKQSKLGESEKNVQKLEKKYDEMSVRHENLLLRHKSMAESIASVESLTKNGVSEKDIVSWQNIFDGFGLISADFLVELEKVGNAKKLFRKLNFANSKLKKENETLKKKKSWLEGNVNDLKDEISNRVEFGTKSLKKITDKTESRIDHAITYTTKSFDDSVKHNQVKIKIMQKHVEDYFSELALKFETLFGEYHNAMHDIGEMDSLKPLRSLTHGKFDPVTAIPIILGILDVLYANISGSNLDSSMLRSDIKGLREKLLKMFNHE